MTSERDREEAPRRKADDGTKATDRPADESASGTLPKGNAAAPSGGYARRSADPEAAGSASPPPGTSTAPPNHERDSAEAPPGARTPPRSEGSADAGRPKESQARAGSPDAGSPDAGSPDAGSPSGSSPSGGKPEEGEGDDSRAAAGETGDTAPAPSGRGAGDGEADDPASTPAAARSGALAHRARPSPRDWLADAPERAAERRKLYSVRRALGFGYLLVVVTFGGVGTWAAMAPLSSAVVASGSVRLERARQAVQHLEGGVVEEIRVKEGDRVEAAQVLVRLDDTRPRARYEMLAARDETLSAQVARLTAERDGAESVTFPEDLTARNDEPRVATVLAGERAVFERRREALEIRLDIYRQRINRSLEQINGLWRQHAATEEQLAYIDDELESVRTLYDKGLISKQRFLALKRERADLLGRIGALEADVARTEEAINETEVTITDVRSRYQEQVTNQLEDAKRQLFDVREELTAAANVLRRTELVAPRSGTVVGLNFHTEGGVVPAGATVLEIVPEDEPFEVEARVRPSDIDDIQTGLPAEIRLSAYSSRSTPTIEGRVVHVSADRIVEPETKTAYYEARIEIPRASLEALADVRLQPGMPADVMIRTGERTALSYLTRPITDAVARGMREK